MKYINGVIVRLRFYFRILMKSSNLGENEAIPSHEYDGKIQVINGFLFSFFFAFSSFRRLIGRQLKLSQLLTMHRVDDIVEMFHVIRQRLVCTIRQCDRFLIRTRVLGNFKPPRWIAEGTKPTPYLRHHLISLLMLELPRVLETLTMPPASIRSSRKS